MLGAEELGHTLAGAGVGSEKSESSASLPCRMDKRKLSQGRIWHLHSFFAEFDKGQVTGYQDSAPNMRADLGECDTQLEDLGGVIGFGA